MIKKLHMHVSNIKCKYVHDYDKHIILSQACVNDAHKFNL